MQSAQRRMARSLVQRRGGYVALQEQVERLQAELGAETVHLILEPTGGYELGVALFAYAQGWVVTKPNPLTLRRWAEGVGYRAKTDPIDACVCAEYGYLMEPDGHALVPFLCANSTTCCVA
ncbi:MAG: transposase [Caldilineaceae bacterium]